MPRRKKSITIQPDLKDKITVKRVPISISYSLTTWPATSKDVPTYDQLKDTLELVMMYLAVVESGAPVSDEFSVEMEDWIKNNDLNRFRQALQDAERHQAMIDAVKVDNGVFPFPLKRFKTRGH